MWGRAGWGGDEDGSQARLRLRDRTGEGGWDRSEGAPSREGLTPAATTVTDVGFRAARPFCTSYSAGRNRTVLVGSCYQYDGHTQSHGDRRHCAKAVPLSSLPALSPSLHVPAPSPCCSQYQPPKPLPVLLLRHPSLALLARSPRAPCPPAGHHFMRSKSCADSTPKCQAGPSPRASQSPCRAAPQSGSQRQRQCRR